MKCQVSGAILQCRNFLQRLVEVTLAEVGEPQICGRRQHGRGLRLADRQECDGVRTPAGRAAACAMRSRTSARRSAKFCGPINILDV